MKTIEQLQALNKILNSTARLRDQGPLLDAWQALSQEELVVVRKELGQHWTVRLSPGAGLIAALAFALLGLFGMYVIADSSTLTGFGVGLASAIVGVTFHHLVKASYPHLLYLLEGASREPFLCKSAADYVETESTVREYRDAVVGQGRELTVLDVNVMLQLAYAQREEKALAAKRQNCLRLHGLFETGGTQGAAA